MEFWFVYRAIILEFLFELYVFYFLTAGKLDRAPRFPLRFLAGAAAMLALALPAARAYQAIGDNVWGRSFLYLLLFAASVLQMGFCFEERRSTVLFCCSMAYAAQNMTYKLFLLLWCGLRQLGVCDGWGDRYELYYHLLYYAFFFAAAAAVYFFLVRRLLPYLSNRRVDQGLLALSLLILGLTVILCSFEDIYFGALTVGGENRFEVWEYFVLRQTGNCFSVVCCAVVLLLSFKTVEGKELQQQLAYLRHAIHQSQRQYEISRDTIDLINVKCHDIRYRLGTMATAGAGVTAEAVDDLQKSISIYDSAVETGNRLLDVLLTEKSLYCEQNGITFSCMADGARLSFLRDGDLYCLFGNIIDNALEAARQVPDRERRVVNLVVKARGDMLVIQEDNYFEGELEFKDGLPQTTKEDRGYHGFGTQSIRMIVRQYGGEMTASAEDGVFHLNILFTLDGDGPAFGSGTTE